VKPDYTLTGDKLKEAVVISGDTKVVRTDRKTLQRRYHRSADTAHRTEGLNNIFIKIVV